MGKGHKSGTFPKCEVTHSCYLVLGPLFWEYPHPQGLPYIEICDVDALWWCLSCSIDIANGCTLTLIVAISILHSTWCDVVDLTTFWGFPNTNQLLATNTVYKVILPSGCEVEFYYSQKDGWFLPGLIKQSITHASLAFGKFKLKKEKPIFIRKLEQVHNPLVGDSKVF